VDGFEILHHLIGGKHTIIYRVSNIHLVVQDFFHQQYDGDIQGISWGNRRGMIRNDDNGITSTYAQLQLA
jgi:hypothetical protein